jgi:23S rRNA pseudouridine2457 synthase
VSRLLLFNKPYNVLSQFTDSEGRQTLADFIDIRHVYAAGRLDKDSEGLLLLTNDGQLQDQIAHPKEKMAKSYWVQVEGDINKQALRHLARGVELKDGMTLPAKVKKISEPENLWLRTPPVRFRKSVPTSWLELVITEGKNRQVRRMTAAVGFPTLRLIRHKIGHWQLGDLKPGHYIEVSARV